jgi:hypothetical protein
MEWSYNEFYPPVLYHYGILGQKWGVRRFQNPDGTLTSAGRKRYRVNENGDIVEKTKDEIRADAKKARAEKLEAQRQLRLEREHETEEKKKERIAKSADPAQIYKHRDMFTSQELSTLYNRMVQENNIKNLIPKDATKKGKTFTEGITSLGNFLGAASNAIDKGSNFYNSIAKVVNVMSDADNQLPIIGQEKKSKAQKEREKKYKTAEQEANYYKNLVNLEKNKKTYADLKSGKPIQEDNKNKKGPKLNSSPHMPSNMDKIRRLARRK